MKLNIIKRFGQVVVLVALACMLALMPGGAFAAAGLSGGGKGAAATASASVGETAVAESDDAAPVKVRAFAQRGWVTVGGDLVIAVVLTHSDKYHTWPAHPLEGEKDVLPGSLTDGEITLFRTSATVAEQPDWVAGVGATQYPEPHPARVADPSGKSKAGITVPCYSGEAVAFIPVVAKSDAAVGARTIKITVTYQACNDKICRNPEDVELQVPVEVVSIEKAATMAASGLSEADAAVFKAFDPQRMVDLRAGKVAVAASGASAGVRFDVFGWQFTIDPRGWGLALLLVCAFVGGVILNFTPCVLPVIPLKIMGLANSAGNPAKCFYLGSVMSAGVVAFWLVLGVMILTISGFTAISSLFAYPLVIMGIGVFILVMGLGMFGMFTVSLPQSVYMLNPKQETAAGSFMFGILTAILATPCTAPFMGTAAAWAAQTKNPTLVLAVFGAIGLGMAVPYFILSANPKLVSKMPSAGPASDLVKQVMGGLMIAVAIFFLGNAMLGLMPKAKIIATAMWWGIAAVSALTALWMLARTIRISSRAVPRVVVAVVSLLLIGVPAVLAVNMTRTDPIPWQEYEAALVQSEAKVGKVVVLDFTAEWCLNCKALESSVLRTEEVVKLLNAPHVSVVKADVTAKTAPGWKALAELGEVGIPLLVVLKKDTGEVVFKSNAYTPQQVIDAVELAGK